MRLAIFTLFNSHPVFTDIDLVLNDQSGKLQQATILATLVSDNEND